MNYLAHAALSLDERDLVTGNLISDFVKGKAQYDLPAGIQKGIRLHRIIDEFTDSHPVTARAKLWFRPQYRLYSGAFVDVVYDHFLAMDARQFASFGGLRIFTSRVYQYLDENQAFLPERFGRMVPFMKSQNWLYNYQFMTGIRDSFQGVVRRAAYLNESQIAYEIFQNSYEALRSCYEEFYPELATFATENARRLLAGNI